MSSGTIIAIVVGIIVVIALIAIIALAARKAKQKAVEHQRVEAGEIRERAASQEATVRRHEADAAEQEARARQVRAEADEKAAAAQKAELLANERDAHAAGKRGEVHEDLRRADEIDPDVNVKGGGVGNDPNAPGHHPNAPGHNPAAPGHNPAGPGHQPGAPDAGRPDTNPPGSHRSGNPT